MEQHLEKARQRLTRSLVRASIKSNLALFVLLLVVLAFLWWLSRTLDLDTGVTATVLIFLLLAAPGVAWFATDWLTMRIWRTQMRDEIQRLRALRFLSSSVEALGKRRLAAVLDQETYERLRRAADREAEGYPVPIDQYASALRVILAVSATREPGVQSGESGQSGPG
jgi:Zn-dependent protease with chaperone function